MCERMCRRALYKWIYNIHIYLFICPPCGKKVNAEEFIFYANVFTPASCVLYKNVFEGLNAYGLNGAQGIDDA